MIEGVRCRLTDSGDSGDSDRSRVLIWRANVGLWIAARLARLKIVISRVTSVQKEERERAQEKEKSDTVDEDYVFAVRKRGNTEWCNEAYNTPSLFPLLRTRENLFSLHDAIMAEMPTLNLGLF